MRRKVKKVVDGDTIELHRSVNGSKYVRLANVNAPEKGTRYGTKASNQLRGMVGGKTVSVKPVGKSYGRTVANITCNRRNINKRMKQKLKR